MAEPYSLDGLPDRPRRTHRVLVLIGTFEALTLLVLLGNLASNDSQRVSQTVGPIHGLLWLSGILLTWTSTKATTSRALAAVPAIGALLAARRLR